MKSILAALLLSAGLIVSAPSAQAAPIQLDVATGGEDFEGLNLTFGSTYGFQFMFTNLAGTGQLQLTSNIEGGTCCGASFSGDVFNYAANVWHTVSNVSVLNGPGTGLLAFRARTYGSGRSGTVLIQNVQVDGRVVAATPVPEPGTLTLLGLGLAGLGIARRRRAT